MRRFALIAAFLFLTAACGCAGRESTPPTSPLAGRNGGYETEARISYKGMQAAATISQQTPDACSVTFSAPETIKGLTFTFGQNDALLEYRGLSFSFASGSVPGGAGAGLAVGAIGQAIKDDGILLRRTDTGIDLDGMLGACDFTLRLDPESDCPVKLFIPSEDLQIEFVNFRFLE